MRTIPEELEKTLQTLVGTHKFTTKGPLSLALVLTRRARDKGLPLDPEDLITPGGGQVKGASGGAAQKVLTDYGVKRKLSSEGSRTSRGSIERMRAYVAFLNEQHAKGDLNLKQIEEFWVARVQDYFAAQPFKISLDASKSLRTVVRNVVSQAVKRQKEAGGTNYAGAVLQHLVGAKLEVAMEGSSLEHNSYSTADAPKGRKGDFLLEDVAIHVTTTPSEAVISKCKENISDGLRPLLITIDARVPVAQGLADNQGLTDRIDIFDIEQFIAFNVYEKGKFKPEGRRATVAKIVERYNEIVDSVETDPSLRIEWKK